ncbi:MAG: helix-turn-helix domain-containing protein [Lachnospiraceae bacterium]|nr:helix-turn-helix domain-containing protein [Lachnospiraceae bacterium]
MNIGRKLKTIRQKKGCTRYRLTQITGISGHHIKGIEEGTRQPTIDTLERLLEALGYSLSEFFCETDHMYVLNDSEWMLIENYRDMDSERAGILLAISRLFK